MNAEVRECLKFLVADFMQRIFKDTALLGHALNRTGFKVISDRDCEQRY